MIGNLLEAIQEAQASGKVDNRRQALELAEDLIHEMDEVELGD
jgi:hypothetical protein